MDYHSAMKLKALFLKKQVPKKKICQRLNKMSYVGCIFIAYLLPCFNVLRRCAFDTCWVFQQDLSALFKFPTFAV